jgi:hypothetical protein
LCLLSFIALTVTAWFYGRFFYAEVPQHLGGGEPEFVRIMILPNAVDDVVKLLEPEELAMGEAPLVEGNVIQGVYVISETQDRLIFFSPRSRGDVVKLRSELVPAVERIEPHE